MTSRWQSRDIDLRVDPGPRPDLPEASPRLRVHDRTHLEFAIDYPVPTDDGAPARKAERLDWDLYLFAPTSLHLDSRTYKKDDFYEDLQGYVRFTVPEAAFHALDGAPLAALERALASGDPSRASRELRLYACQVRSAGEEERWRISSRLEMGVDAEDPVPDCWRFVADAERIGERLRQVLAPARGAPEPLSAALAWIDEDVSRLLEALQGELVLSLRAYGPTVPAALIAAAEAGAVQEARYRQRMGLEGVGHVGMDRREVEHIEFRRHVLKRFTSSALWLATEVRPAATWVVHILNFIAAALAMAFATVAALWNGADTGGHFTRWALVVVIAYALKDRIKALLQARFAQVVSRSFPDRHWRIRDLERGIELGTMSEQSGFLAYRSVPPDVLALRRMTFRHPLEEQARPETVIYHHKTTALRRDRITAADARFTALTEILRVDLRRWLAHTDDPRHEVAFADPELGVVDTAPAPRVYNIALIYRVRGRGAPSDWRRVRVVISRKGILRVDRVL